VNVVLVADGSPAVGAGHQVRLAALAEHLVARGHRALLVAADVAGSPHSWAWRGLEHELWPGTEPAADAAARIAHAIGADWLVIDHYGIDGRALERLASLVAVLVVDDVPGRDLAAARLVLNQNVGVVAGEYPGDALVGPEHALLRRPFAAGPGEPPGDDVAVMLGGTDASGLTGRVCRTLVAAGFPVFAISGGGIDDLPPGVAMHRGADAQTLARLLRGARAAVVAAGSSVYELLALGVPFVALHLVANQDRIARGLIERRLAPVIAAAAIDRLPALVAGLRRGASPAIDGRGADRVIDEMERRCHA